MLQPVKEFNKPFKTLQKQISDSMILQGRSIKYSKKKYLLMF